MTNHSKKQLNHILFHLFVILLGYCMLYPILWMIGNSFKTTQEIFGSASLLPKEFHFDNYSRGWEFNKATTFTTFFKNSFYYTILSTIGAVFSSAIVAYGFARIKFRGHNFWYACMFLTLMLPYQVVMIPQFILFKNIGWINTFLPLIVPQFTGQAFFIFLTVQFIRGIPHELDESAMIDGYYVYDFQFLLAVGRLFRAAPLSKQAEEFHCKSCAPNVFRPANLD